jgi:hypothetical protein
MSLNRTPVQVAAMANSLYHSLLGQYFVGFADNMSFGVNEYAFAALANPRNSGVNLFVNVWTVTNLNAPPVLAQIFLNSRLTGAIDESQHVTPTNTAIRPLSRPRVHLIQASNICAAPYCGTEAYERIIPAVETVADEEDGKFIIPPGGNFAVFLSDPTGSAAKTDGKVAFGWWESPVCNY